MWVSNGAYTLSCRDRDVVLSRREWLTDKIICAVFSQHGRPATPHTAEGVCVSCPLWGICSNHIQSGVVRVYDSLYKTLSKQTVRLITSMVYVPSSELKVVMMDVEKQSNGSDCGVLAIAYAFDICSGMNPCSVRFDHSKIRPHLINCLENCQVSRFPVLGQRESVERKPKTVELHCSCLLPGDEMAKCDSCHVWYQRHCMDIPREVFGESEVHWECKRCVKTPI